MIPQKLTLLFDLDGTLMHEWESAEYCFIETLHRAGITASSADILQTVRPIAREEWYKLPTIDYCLKIGFSSWEALWSDFSYDNPEFTIMRQMGEKYRFNTWHRALAAFGLNDERKAIEAAACFKQLRNNRHILFPESIELLKQLKAHYRLGLITNGAPDIQWKKINGGQLKDYFEYIAISGEHGFGKPDIALFDIAVRQLGANKENTFVIGDNLTTDIKGGNDYGIKTIWVNRHGNVVDEIKPDFEIPDLRVIEQVISTIV